MNSTYTPGYTWSKLAMVLLGFALFLPGALELWTPLRLLAFGEKTYAEALSVTKTKTGNADLVLKDDLEIQKALESRDRSYTFWNEFRFTTRDEKNVEVRAPIGSQLKPLYTLLDDDGLPTTDLVFYDPVSPQAVVFPFLISTWFAAGSLVIIGLGCMGLGGTLLYWSNKPIEMPHLPPQSKEV